MAGEEGWKVWKAGRLDLWMGWHTDDIAVGESNYIHILAHVVVVVSNFPVALGS